MATRKHPGAVALGKRRMELLTVEQRQELAGKANERRTKVLSPARRKAIAQKAAAARWGKKKAS